MTIKDKKSQLADRILHCNDAALLAKVEELLSELSAGKRRAAAGWGKGMVTYVSDDFDDFIPPGFCE